MDHLSVKSGSSDNASEFEVVPFSSSIHSEVGLKIAGNGDERELRKHMDEVLISSSSSLNISLQPSDAPLETEAVDEQRTSEPDVPQGVDQSFPKLKDESSVVEEDCILFSGIFYLGCASVRSPRDEEEALKTIAILRSQQLQSAGDQNRRPSQDFTDKDSQHQIEIVLSIPSQADGLVKLLDPEENCVIASFKLYTILFCIRGSEKLDDNDCFAFTESRQSSGIFQCHVFRCDIPEAVRKVLYSLELAFKSIPKNAVEELTVPVPSSGLKLLKRSAEESASISTHAPEINYDGDHSIFCFDLTLEIREDDGKGSFTGVPWDKTSSSFKFRANHEKQFNINVCQTTNLELTIERCFGLLLSPGRNIKHSDMHLLDMEKPSSDDEPVPGATHFITGRWDPSLPQFSMLNTETAKGSYVFLSVAVDLVIQEIQEPVRFLVETRASVFPQNEKMWSLSKKLFRETFFVYLTEVEHHRSHTKFAVESIETVNSRMKPTSNSNEDAFADRPNNEVEDDNDEPLLSGSGTVSMECSERVLSDWGDVLQQWREDLTRQPSGVRSLVRSGTGVPEALRGEVWLLLAGCVDNNSIMENYRLLIAKDSPQENIIQRDIHRTFPAHDYFKEAGGTGQESLYRISKAYSVYDHEVGYCQGLSFLAAALLLHMPEEQAFCILVQIMYDYKMRNLFKNGFEDLHLKFYQLEKLMSRMMPNLHDHFQQLNIECHMFSSQWFLTLFTAKFPLNMVYHVLDVFLCEGELVVFQIALGLLESCRRELLTLDFEGVLKYFRVQLPKKYRSEENVKLLIRTAVQFKVTHKKLNDYQKSYEALKEKRALEEDPSIRIKRENQKLMESNMRLELENDDIAQELVTTRITLSTQLERTMKHAEGLQRELQAAIGELRSTRAKVAELGDENNRLVEETKQVKEMCRREVECHEEDLAKKTSIIKDYKTICSQLSSRIEQIQAAHKEEIASLRKARANSSDDVVAMTSNGNVADEEVEKLQRHVRSLELDLAQTKLKLVEAECKLQDVEHQLTATSKELHASKNTWIHKTFLSLSNKKNDHSPNGQSPVNTRPNNFLSTKPTSAK